ncbi:hypothetical protein MARVELLAND_9 [Bacillus phage vB_BspM_MarvelLand]|nr:hypothetical protein MARVELLAND_9 [Bacillus phage vB_BspM_MarvelLand]
MKSPNEICENLKPKQKFNATLRQVANADSRT